MWLNIEDITEGMKKSAIGQDEKIVFAVARLTDKYKQDEFIKTKKGHRNNQRNCWISLSCAKLCFSHVDAPWIY